MVEKKKLHLICNAHLDPVWLWRWDEGAAEAISTFRVAADFCEQYEGFVFNHNEALLYQWIERYEPELFARIQRLAAEGRWHIMGGWYLQPDCNMPCGEGLVRQIEKGRRWFYEKFGVLPTVAVNVDSFGHSRGLVQILKKTGYEGYLFCRPLREFLGKVINEWGYDSFVWEGFDGSAILGHRHFAIYNSPFGKAEQKLDYYLSERGDRENGLLLWGIGDHGGGPSRIDLERLNSRMDGEDGREIVHSSPEAFFGELKKEEQELPVLCRDLNPWAVGGYTTQAEVKRRFRKLESELLATEKMLSMAWVCCGLPYPEKEMEEAEETLLFAQFHDIIPGTLIPSALEESLRHMDRGLDILGQEKTRAFFALAGGQEKTEEGAIPLLAFNPHPHPVEGIFSCEFHMNQTFSRKHFLIVPHLYRDGKEIPCQLEQEESQMPMQWRRKVTFRAVLEPMQMNRFVCRMEREELKEPPYLPKRNGIYEFSNDRICVKINTRTGLLESYAVDGKTYAGGGAFAPVVMEDDDHSIGTFVTGFREEAGRFRLMDRAAASQFSGTSGRLLEPVHMTEEGPVRTVVEAMLEYGTSQLCLRYYLPAQGTELEVEAIVHWNEKAKLLKLAIPTAFETPDYIGQTAYGVQALPSDGSEAVSQRWSALSENGAMLSVINDRIYGSSVEKNELRLTLLRSPRYGCLSKDSDRYALYNSGYVAHTDQGVHRFRFWLNAGAEEERRARLEREAAVHHEEPYLLSFFPSGAGRRPGGFLRLEAEQTVLAAVRPSRDGKRLTVRLYNPGDTPERAVLYLDYAGKRAEVQMGAFEIKTLLCGLADGETEETDLLEGSFPFRQEDSASDSALDSVLDSAGSGEPPRRS